MSTSRTLALIAGGLFAIALLAMLPVSSFALSTNKSNYALSESVTVTCSNQSDVFELYDITSGIDGDPFLGGNLGLFDCSSSPLSFAGVDGHTYAIIELDQQATCSDLGYAGCEFQPFAHAEIDFTVGDGATPGSITSSAPLTIQTSKTHYAIGETVQVSCGYAHGTFQLYDMTEGIDGVGAQGGNLGQYDCSSASFSTEDGHTYAVIELAPTKNCSDVDYSGCVVQGFTRGEADFSVGSAAEPPPQSFTEGTSKSVYGVHETVYVMCTYEHNAFQLYDITPGIDGVTQAGGNIGLYSCGTPVAVSFDSNDSHTYSIVEITAGSSCDDRDYSGCKAQGFFRAEFQFSVADNAFASFVSQPPAVSIQSPIGSAPVPRDTTIMYRALDQDDNGDATAKKNGGLGASSVSLYFSDKVGGGTHAIVPSSDKTLIKRGLPAVGSYLWRTAALLPGVIYRVIVDAVDNSGLVGEAISDPFRVDLQAPTFIIKTVPTAIRGEGDVAITVESSEELGAIPQLNVTQQGASPVTVLLSGAHKLFRGKYHVSPGHDGVANLLVQGTDIAGNVGTTTLSGGTFAVGINPPPAPKTEMFAAEEITYASTTEVHGKIRPDTKAIVIVNGVDTYVGTPTADGSFSIQNIRLSKETNQGLNILSIATKDTIGVSSAPVTRRIKYEAPPSVSVSRPLTDAAVSGTVTLSASSTDENGDSLAFTYQLISVADFTPGLSATSTKNTWLTLAEAVPASGFQWDSTEVESGQYYVRILADDDIVKAYSAPRRISVRNTLPLLRFDDGRTTTTRQDSVTVTGHAVEPDALVASATITSVDYSLDNGTIWKKVPITTTDARTGVPFSVTFTGLKEGTKQVLWRAGDSRKLYGKALHPIIVDRMPPAAPSVISPEVNTFLTKDQDENKLKEGLQISITGTAEPYSTVTLSLASLTYTTKTAFDGTYALHNVTIGKHGTNDAFVTATDASGNVSAKTTLPLVYDNPPLLALISPQEGRGVTGSALIRWSVSDPDKEPIRRVILSYRKGTGAFRTLVDDASLKQYSWNVTDLPEGGNYQLRLEASDGFATSTASASFYVDHTPPRLDSFTLESKILTKNGELTGLGQAFDALSGIEFVESNVVPEGSASTESWFRGSIISGFLSHIARFKIAYPPGWEDGVYAVHARAVDAAGNTSPVRTERVVIDTSPPRIGSFSLEGNGVSVLADRSGTLVAYADTAMSFGVSLEDDTKSAVLSVASTTYPLRKDLASGLWKVELPAATAGVSPLSLTASDNLGNHEEHTTVGTLERIEKGRATYLDAEGTVHGISHAPILIYARDETSRDYTPYMINGQTSITTDADGRYELALPRGNYSLRLALNGFRTIDKKITIDSPRFIDVSFVSKPLRGIGGFVGGVLDWLTYSL